MAKKKNVSLAERLGRIVGDMANAVSVAATGSEIGMLESAAEGELSASPVKRARKRKNAPKKKAAINHHNKPVKKKHGTKRLQRARTPS